MAISRTWYDTLVDDSGGGTDGTVLDKADFDALLDAVDELTANRAAVFHNTTQSVADDTVTPVVFNSEDFDTAGLHSTSVNTSRITIPAGGGGVYLIQAKVNFVSNATGYRQLRILKNGNVVGTLVTQAAINGVSTAIQIVAVHVLAAADYVEVGAYQDSGGALNIGDASTRAIQNEFTVVQLMRA